MSHKAIVLGCGLVGATMARDLADDPDFEVTAADLSEKNLRAVESAPRVTTVQVDLGDPAKLRSTIQGFDIVLGALPSRFGFATLRTVIECGKRYSDISFMPEEALELDDLAKKHGVTAIVDCGVSPGLSNMMVGRAHAQLDRTDSVVIYVGGLPKVRRWPYQYKAPFAPADVIEEYTRPARMVENGRLVVKPALSEPELIDFPRIGTLEAFNTDGLRSLLRTVSIPNMREKTLRYPGHCELMRVLRETGFFDKSEIEVRGVNVRPLDVTSKLLFPQWTYEEDEEEFTLLRVVVEGQKDARPARYTYELYDEYDRTTHTSSMARTTGFPAAIVARLLVKGEINQPGVLPPELLTCRNEAFDHFDHMVQALRERRVIVEAHCDSLERSS